MKNYRYISLFIFLIAFQNTKVQGSEDKAETFMPLLVQTGLIFTIPLTSIFFMIATQKSTDTTLDPFTIKQVKKVRNICAGLLTSQVYLYLYNINKQKTA